MIDIDIFDLAAKITLDSSGYERNLNNARSSLDDFADGMQGAITKATIMGNAIYDAAKKAASGLASLAKAAVGSYAETEQLIGGVETLFKESAGVVQQYADNAYKTAGLSANQYMETVTSFSASLLQSLGGDTAKATEVANMAITDMADNANKMGTAIESIQNAYQGFAKGNYTMLDNLKLGYGGTAREMARLINESGVLSEAQKINLDDTQKLGAALQEVGFDKMIEAIHKVQTEMGITGTTALEAAETISGSVATMKSAWENWLSGLANPDADMAALTDNLIASIETAAQNVAPAVAQIGDSLLQVFEDVTGIDTQPLVDAFADIEGAITNLKTAAQEGGIGGVVDEVVGMIREMTGVDISPVVSAIGELANIIKRLADAGSSGGISGVTNEITNMVGELIGADISPVIDGLSGLADSIDEIASQDVSEISNNMRVFFDNLREGTLGETIVLVAGGVLQLAAAFAKLASGTIADITQTVATLSYEFEELPAILVGVGTAIVTFIAVVYGMQILQTVSTWIKAAQTAMLALNAVLMANPIALVVALIAGLVAAFVTAYQTSDEFRQKVDTAFAAIKEAVESAISAVKEKVSDFIQAGKDIVNGLIEGVAGGISSFVKKVKEVASAAVEGVKDFLGIHSPSRVFRGIGDNMMAGLSLGVENAVPETLRKIQNSMRSVVDGSTLTFGTVDFADSAAGRSSSGMINGMIAAASSGQGQYNINLVTDGRTLASVVFDPLTGIAKQKGVGVFA